MTRNEVDEIAQGRIWSGIDAKEIGLVDVLGGLDRAIDIAREKAGMKEDAYQLQIYKGVEETNFEFTAESRSELLSLSKKTPVVHIALTLYRGRILTYGDLS